MSADFEHVRLGSVLERVKDEVLIKDDATYSRLTIRMNGRGIDIRDTLLGFEIGTKRQFIATSGQLVLSKIDARNGAFGVLPAHCDNAIITGNFWAFDVDDKRLLPQYFDYLTRTPLFLDFCIRASEGTTNRRYLQEEAFLSQEIPLPPLDEQRRIVARIDELATKVEEARGLRQSSTEVTATVIGRRIAEIFKSRQHSSWRPALLGEYVLDDCYGTSEKTNDDVSGTPILRMGNIQNGRLITSSLKYLHVPQKERDKLILAPGDILVNRTNSAELVGKCAVFDLEGDYGFASYIIRIRLDQNRALPRLVASYINSPIGRAYMFDERKQMTGQANVNATTLKNLPLPLPDIEAQRQIVAELDALQAKVDAVKALQIETAAELDAMLPAILDKAFRGELVAQETTDDQIEDQARRPRKQR